MDGHRGLGPNRRVPLLSFARCSRGGKTRALNELEMQLRARDGKRIQTLFVSFSDYSDSHEEKSRGDSSVEMLCRRIAFAARPWDRRSPDDAAHFEFFRNNVVVSRKDVMTWIGRQIVVLLIDELNNIDLDHDIVTFLKTYFLISQGRYYVFSSHTMGTNPENSSPSESFRELQVADLPLSTICGRQKRNLDSKI